MNTKKIVPFLLIFAIAIFGCKQDKVAQLAKLRKQHDDIAEQIKKLESESTDSTKVQKSLRVTVATVKPETFKHYIEVQGKLDGEDNVDVYPESQGIIDDVLVTVGQSVTKGQALAHIDKGPARDQLKALETQYKFASETFEKQQRLWDQKIGSEMQYLQAKTAKEQLESQLGAVRKQIDMMTIKAPITGTVEEVNIKGLEKILLWAKGLARLQTFLYIGTATICGKNITNRLVYEDESPDENAAHLVRYTYTKMQGELLLSKHLPQQKILVARPSIIMGDSRPVLPRSPIILWAVATINQLRLIPVNEYACLDMISVDFAADAIVGLLFAKRHYQVYHISSGKSAATSAYKLSLSLSNYFTGVPPFLFVNKSLINQLKSWAKGHLAGNSELKNFPLYLDYWHTIFPDTGALRILLAGLEPYLGFMELGQVFDNSRLFEDVPGLKQPVAADVYINECMPFIASINTLEGAFDS